MTIEEAIRILDPETSREALQPYAYDNYQRHKVVEEACRVAVKELRRRQWISVEDKLPKSYTQVITSTNHGLVCMNGLNEHGEFDNYPCEITHWRELPEPPESNVEEQV